MKLPTLIIAAALLIPSAARAEEWHFKKTCLQSLVEQVPGILKSLDRKNGRFGTGIWIVTDQNHIYPLAVAWATKIDGVDNRFYHDADLLEAIMSAGDALIADQHPDGTWQFRKKDGSTWGDIYMPWTYARWIHAYALIRDSMPADRRAKWETALKLGFEGIYKTQLGDHMANIPSYNAMALYQASQLFDRKDWQEGAVAFLRRCASGQSPDGFWSEHFGPVVIYNGVYVDLMGCYYGMSHDPAILPVLARSSKFTSAMTYPDGRAVETVDERNFYQLNVIGINVGFAFTPEGRAYLKRQIETMSRYTQHPIGADVAANLILYGEEGQIAPPPPKSGDVYVSGDKQAMTRRDVPWFFCLSSYHSDQSTSRWIQDRQNFVSLYHDGLHVIVGGGNTKLQPLWSTFTVGDPALLSQKLGEENPDFIPPSGLLHVPSNATIDPAKNTLDLEYGDVKCSVTVDTSLAKTARIIYSLLTPTDKRVEAHVPLLGEEKKTWSTASDKSGTLSAEPFKLAPGEAGDWIAHRGWQVSVPAEASLQWPVFPHNPYTKDGHADLLDARIVMTLPFDKDHTRYEIAVQAAGKIDDKDTK